MSTCATCKYLGVNAEHGMEVWDDAADEGHGDLIETEHRPCARIIHGNHTGMHGQGKRVSVEPAVVTDGSGFAARLRVLPTFGCNLHEPKDGKS